MTPHLVAASFSNALHIEHRVQQAQRQHPFGRADSPYCGGLFPETHQMLRSKWFISACTRQVATAGIKSELGEAQQHLHSNDAVPVAHHSPPQHHRLLL